MKNAHKIMGELLKKHVAELCEYDSICLNDNKPKLCLEDRSGRRHAGSGNWVIAEIGMGGCPISSFYSIYFFIV